MSTIEKVLVNDDRVLITLGLSERDQSKCKTCVVDNCSLRGSVGATEATVDIPTARSFLPLNILYSEACNPLFFSNDGTALIKLLIKSY